MREKFKTLSAHALKLSFNPFVPHDVRVLVADLVNLLGEMADKLEKLESSQPKENKTHGDL